MKTKFTSLFIVILVFFTSCESELDKYYETPKWLKGNAWQVLEDKGNFKLFLSAVERTSFKDLVQGKGLITVMAPTDDAFKTYLSKHGYASVNDIPIDQLEVLVGYHLVYYSFNKDGFENYKPEGVDAINYYPGQYFKFRTKSRDAIVTIQDPTDNNARKSVIRKERFLPVYSFNLFGSGYFKMDAKSNYEYFYPESKWTGDAGFNIANASVLDYAIVTDNGYVYSLDQVIEPLETIFNEMKKYPDYDLFRNAYDRFVSFEYDASATQDYGKGDSLFVRYHTPLPPIDSEWTLTSLGTNDYMQLASLASRSYNVFAPDNASMTAFFNKYWANYYQSLDQVNFIPMLYFLDNHVYSSAMLFPEQIESGTYSTDFGSTIKIDRNKPKVKKMASNGSFYGMDEVMVPSVFEKVTAPMFCNPAYNLFLDMVANSSHSLLTLTSDAVQFKIFYPSNDMILKNTTLEGKAITYSNSNAKKFGAQSIMIEGDNGPVTMNASQKTTIAGSHIATEQLSKRGNKAIYRTLNNYNYIYTEGDKVYSSALFNKNDNLSTPTMVKDSKTWSNGEAYYLEGETASALVPESNQFKSVIVSNQYPADYTYFKYLIDASGLGTSTPPFSFLQGDRYIVLVPTDAALLAGIAAGKVPFSPASAVAKFLQPYFIKVSDSNLLDYPFSGTGVSATLVSFAKNSQNNNITFHLSDNNTNLIIRDAKGNNATVLTYFPRIYADGAVYLIDRLLEVE